MRFYNKKIQSKMKSSADAQSAAFESTSNKYTTKNKNTSSPLDQFSSNIGNTLA